MLLVMLAFGLSYIILQVITCFEFLVVLSSLAMFFLEPVSSKNHIKRRQPTSNNNLSPLRFFCENLGLLSNCVMLYYWFVVARYLGLYHSLSPRWQSRQKPNVKIYRLAPIIGKPRKPPDKHKFCRGCFILFFFYV
jgi:hypothetical protein